MAKSSSKDSEMTTTERRVIKAAMRWFSRINPEMYTVFCKHMPDTLGDKALWKACAAHKRRGKK